MQTQRTRMVIVAHILAISSSVVLGCRTYRPTPASDEFKNSFAVMDMVELVEKLTDSIAPTEFECTKDKMVFKKVGDWTRIQVTGCDKRGTYVFVDTVGWVLNTDIQYYVAEQPKDDGGAPTGEDPSPTSE